MEPPPPPPPASPPVYLILNLRESHPLTCFCIQFVRGPVSLAHLPNPRATDRTSPPPPHSAQPLPHHKLPLSSCLFSCQGPSTSRSRIRPPPHTAPSQLLPPASTLLSFRFRRGLCIIYSTPSRCYTSASTCTPCSRDGTLSPCFPHEYLRTILSTV